ncbi:hypothetical protein JOL62DRAFT_330454 [Phyllosticta paracitricarpa]|uniref:DUF6536 domain-containing protein n=1 Tax=Phyllosticta paracitricarpa TaxID=2016321 RepID=A0ABR1MUA2_9PEZI
MDDSQSGYELEETSPLRPHAEHENSRLRNFDLARDIAAAKAEKSASELSNPSEVNRSKRRRFAHVEDLATWIPDASKPAKWTNQRAVLLCIHMCLATGVLLMNIGFAATSIYNFQMNSYTGQYFAGNCSSVKVANRWIHLGINALSSLLLLSSNYCSQILMAPTREEVDRKHAKKDWFDIGVQSLRNWKRIALKRRVVCTILMVSSGLLHLVWNSAVFSATPVSYYHIAIVTSDFETGPSPQEDVWINGNITPHFEEMRYNIGGLDRLNKTQCFDRYIGGSVGMGDLIVVTSNVTMADNQSVISNASTSLLDASTSQRGSNWILYNFWMCSRWWVPGTGLPEYWCTRDFLEPRLDEWTWKADQYSTPAQKEYLYSWYYKIDYCLSDGDNSKELEQQCELQFSSIVLIVVCVLNLVKCLCIAYTAHIQWQSTVILTPADKRRVQGSKRPSWLDRIIPERLRTWLDGLADMKNDLRENWEKLSLVTVGDAIASFLDHKDEHTQDMEMASMADFIKQWPDKNHEFQFPKETRWLQSASRKTWYLSYSLISLFAIITGPLLGLTLFNLARAGIPIDLASLWHQGLGSFNPFAYAIPQVIMRLPPLGQYFVSTLMANIFQVLLSFLYLVYNSLITSLLLADEWNRFLSSRKSLRVSTPRSLQRSSYFLSLPFKYSVPLTILNTLLHWLVSQCFFVVASVEYVTPHLERDHSNDSFIIGFSTIAIVLVIAVGAVLFLVPMPLAWWWRLKAPASVNEDEGEDDGVQTSNEGEGEGEEETTCMHTSCL